jgi:hypothetical protein
MTLSYSGAPLKIKIREKGQKEGKFYNWSLTYINIARALFNALLY